MIPTGFKPQLAVNHEKVKLQPKYLFCSEKLDGVRVLFFGGIAYSRSLKPLPNKQLQLLAQNYSTVLEGCDGEVIAGNLYAKDVLQQSTSFAMSEEKVTDFTVYLFDRYIPDEAFIDRFESLIDIEVPNVRVLDNYKIPSIDCLFMKEFESRVLASGGEGVIVRDAFGLYKCGRSATKKPELQKVKRFTDDEFEVVGYTQFEHNANEPMINEVGRTQRSTSKEGKVLVEALGSLVCKLKNGKTFNVGSGFTANQREQLWIDRDRLLGELAKVKFFHYSADGVPLLPTFIAFRNKEDL